MLRNFQESYNTAESLGSQLLEGDRMDAGIADDSSSSSSSGERYYDGIDLHALIYSLTFLAIQSHPPARIQIMGRPTKGYLQV